MGKDIPVYVITGFLEGGKTSFLKFTLKQDYFNDGSKTLLLLCEEGEVEFEEEFLKKYNCVCEVVEEKEQLMNPAYLKAVGKKHRPERVIIEYNGMWSPKEIGEIKLPFSWDIYQTITVLDGNAFRLYLNNIKSLAMELLTYTDMVIFNRCDENTPVEVYNRSLKAVNKQAEVMFEDINGETIVPPVILPYSLEQDEIVLEDEDYGIWYIDVQEHPENYAGKTISFKAMVMKSKEFPEGMFVPGRNVMTCCADDIRFLGFICKYNDVKMLKRRQWIRVKAKFAWEYSEVYEEEGPVLYAETVEPTTAPLKDEVTF